MPADHQFNVGQSEILIPQKSFVDQPSYVTYTKQWMMAGASN